MVDVVERLEARARATPDAPAVVERSGVTSYAAFCDRAHAFAAAFAGARRVVIALDKGRDAYAAMFGALMAGATYAPVNVSSPEVRLRHICEVFEPDVVVAGRVLASLASGPRAALIEPGALPVAGPRLPQPAALAPDLLAYVMFTSGSTGAPKGVAIPRAALAHYVDWLGPAMGIGPGDRMSQHPNIGFDLSVLDIYGALCWGAALHPFTEASARLLPARKVEADRITIWNSVPSVVSLMMTAGELDAGHLASVRLFTFCGEILRQDQVAALFAARPDATVFNTYGPTEATVAMTCRELKADNHARLCPSSAPLGDAIGVMRLHLASDPGDGEGEIVISGPQLAAGYWGDPVLTAEKFRDFDGPGGPVRAFYTGDYAARIEGELYFLGRRDDMVKLRGHRVHLGEVRRALGGLGYGNAFIFAKDDALFAVVERSGQVFDEKALIAALSASLDSYFVPEAIICIDRLPLTSNDKIDGGTLKALFDKRPA